MDVYEDIEDLTDELVCPVARCRNEGAIPVLIRGIYMFHACPHHAEIISKDWMGWCVNWDAAKDLVIYHKG